MQMTSQTPILSTYPQRKEPMNKEQRISNVIEDLAYGRRSIANHQEALIRAVANGDPTTIARKAGYLKDWNDYLDSTMNAVDRYMDVSDALADALMDLRQGEFDEFLATHPTGPQVELYLSRLVALV